MVVAQIETGLSVVDKAAAASDRWLFLAALAIIIAGGVAVIRYLVNSLEKKDAAHSNINTCLPLLMFFLDLLSS
jgi:hypothetical protein